jgi:molybdopterin adenylyltransferase
MQKTAAVITVSDRSYRGEREDLSGPTVDRALREAGFETIGVDVVPDVEEQIRTALSRYLDRAALVVTTGGTGIAKRDVTPEATTAICDRLIPGIPEMMRNEGQKKNAMAPLSRAVCGTRGSTLFLNLPGSPNGAVESLKAVLPLVLHALQLLAGDTDHPA